MSFSSSLRTFGLLFAASVAVNTLGATKVEAQCPRPYPTIHEVSTSRAQGPLVFLTGCSTGAASACATGSKGVRVGRLGSGALVEGSNAPMDLGGGQWLVFFTPTTPIEPQTHVVEILGDNLSKITFGLRPEYVGDPLSELSLVEKWVSTPSGPEFTCTAERSLRDNCMYTLSFHLTASLEPTLSVKALAADGWLFSVASAPWSITPKATAQVTAGVEHCFTVQGWNVLTDVKTSRQVCGTAAPRSDADRRARNPVRPLSNCEEPPRKVGTSEPAQELMGEWCQERGAICSRDATQGGCTELDKLCRSEESADASVAEVQDDAGTMDAASMDAASESGANNGCQLSRSTSRSWFALATTLTAMFVTRRRSRSRRCPSHV